MPHLISIAQEEGAKPQERIDFVEIDSDFKLSEAINSLKFYWNLAKRQGKPLAYELWAEAGAVVPVMEVRHAKALALQKA